MDECLTVGGRNLKKFLLLGIFGVFLAGCSTMTSFKANDFVQGQAKSSQPKSTIMLCRPPSMAYEILTPNHAQQMGEKYSVKFAGAVGLYPGCSPQMINEPTKSPLLLIVGEADDWTLPKYCYDLARSAKFSSTPGFDIEMKSIQGAGHSFDYYWEHITMRGVMGQGGKVGVTVGGSQAQRAEAENLTWEFISRVINKKVSPRVSQVAVAQPSESKLQLPDIREPTEEDVRAYEKKQKPKK